MAKKKVVEVPKQTVEKINVNPLEEIMGDRYATYAKYVIQDRAIPDVRDGLKPVQRRIIFAMYTDGNVYKKPTRKCATTVGSVMGHFHPHGDSSIYEALAHMSQNWKFRLPLVDFQGNNGSIDGDSPAAHRYTEARLAEVSEELVRDIDKNTVDMQLTFDDANFEPTVLPAHFPNLLVNGTQGIAVALATNIPPHNLGEVCEAVIYRMTHIKTTVEDLLGIVHGPDFPTGGVMIASEGLTSIYTTGRGRVEIMSRYSVVQTPDGPQIVITEIPYAVVKSKLVHDIDVIRHNKTIDGIVEVRDESDHEGLRIAIDIKKEANPDVIVTYLMNKTELKSAFNANMVAIVNGHPRTLTLLQFIDAYIDHQVDIITRRSHFELNKATARLSIVDGLIKAISVLDQVVAIIRASKDKADAKKNLIAKFAFTEEQAEAIVVLQLYKLTNTDVTVLVNEKHDLEKKIAELEGILGDRKKLDKVIINDLRSIVTRFGTARKTTLQENVETIQIDKRDLIVKEDVMVVITRDGYFKRSSIKSYKSSDGALPGLKPDDVLIGYGKANTADYVLAFTTEGNYLFVPVHEIVEGKWKEEGKHVNYLVSLPGEEKILKALIVETFREDLNIAILTVRGQIKRSKLSDFFVQRYGKPIGCVKLFREDEVADVALTTGNSDLIVLTSEGNASFYNENDITLTGIKTSGVKAINNMSGDEKAVALLSYDPGERGKVAILTDVGCLRLFDSGYLVRTPRLGKVQYVYKSFKSDKHDLVYAAKLDKKAETLTLNFLKNDLTPGSVTLDDFHPTPVDKYAKKNIPLPAGQTIVSVYGGEMTVVDASFVSYEPPLKEELPVVKGDENDESAKGYEQISIFDDLDENK
mgnify:CR=1 FL=1